MNTKENNIVFESNNFYVYKVKNGFEIRKNESHYSIAIGIAETLEQAKRFINRIENNLQYLKNL